MSRAYYNEIDPKAAAWLRELIKAGLIAPGDVDERSIEDVKSDDLMGYTQCHFFAGIGVWSYALRQAGWLDDREVWTGSCPCQPFSTAGKGKGKDDERHLWPHFYRLIAERKPNVVFGEQVGSKAGLDWLDDVQSNMETSGYAIGAVTFPACSVGAPHQRQRLYWVAQSSVEQNTSRIGWGGRRDGNTTQNGRTLQAEGLGSFSELADYQSNGPQRQSGHGNRSDEPGRQQTQEARSVTQGCEPCDPGSTNGFWGDVDWLYCRDGKWRPVEPGTFPLVNGAASRVGRLRSYGNAIVAEQAAAFIEAFKSNT